MYLASFTCPRCGLAFEAERPAGQESAPAICPSDATSVLPSRLRRLDPDARDDWYSLFDHQHTAGQPKPTATDTALLLATDPGAPHPEHSEGPSSPSPAHASSSAHHPAPPPADPFLDADLSPAQIAAIWAGRWREF